MLTNKITRYEKISIYLFILLFSYILHLLLFLKFKFYPIETIKASASLTKTLAYCSKYTFILPLFTNPFVIISKLQIHDFATQISEKKLAKQVEVL